MYLLLQLQKCQGLSHTLVGMPVLQALLLPFVQLLLQMGFPATFDSLHPPLLVNRLDSAISTTSRHRFGVEGLGFGLRLLCHWSLLCHWNLLGD